MTKEEDVPSFPEFKKILDYLQTNRETIERLGTISPDKIAEELSIPKNRVVYSLEVISFSQWYVPEIKVREGELNIVNPPKALVYRKSS